MELRIFETAGPQTGARMKKGGMKTSADEGFSSAMTDAMDKARKDEILKAGKNGARTVEKRDCDTEAAVVHEEEDGPEETPDAAEGVGASAVPFEAADMKKTGANPASGDEQVKSTGEKTASLSEAEPLLNTEDAGDAPVVGAVAEKALEAKLSDAGIPPEPEAVDDGKAVTDAAIAKRGEKAAHDAKAAVFSVSEEQGGAEDALPSATANDASGDGAISIEAARDFIDNGAASFGKEDGGGDRQAGLKTMHAGGVSVFSKENIPFESVTETKPLSAAERIEVYEKFSSGVRMSVANNGGEIRLSLRPDHLGNLNIRLNIDETLVKARILVESAAVKDVLDGDAGALKDIFAKNGLVLDRYSVEIAPKSFGFDSGGPNEHAGFPASGENAHAGLSGKGRNASARIGEQETLTVVNPENGDPRRVSGIDLFI
ncbi:MAG: flagellar hook-length control protein FliK [Deltaproteobacteria bacterium]|nr:flagellar hook-length control protein FliK [Deltaproteobacteria bacterium]